MSGLETKAKTHFQCPKCGSRKIQWMANIIICLDCDYRDNARNFEVNLVRLEDAQKAVAEADKDYDILQSGYETLAERREELEGKLAEAQKEITNKDFAIKEVIRDRQKLEEKVEELEERLAAIRNIDIEKWLRKNLGQWEGIIHDPDDVLRLFIEKELAVVEGQGKP